MINSEIFCFKAVIFDLDGTLLDTLADLGNSMNAALAKYGFGAHSLDKYRYFIGDGVEALVKRTVPREQLDEETFQNCLAEMRSQYSKRWAENTKPYEGIVEMLAELERLGIPKTIFSNKPDDFTQLTVETLLPGFSFDVIRGALPGVAKKPDPAGAIRIAEEVNVEPAEFLYLGDTNTDMQTANAAGMYAAGVLWGFREADELLENGAKVLIEKPSEIVDLLTSK